MSQVLSLPEASDLLKKLFDERVPISAFLISPSRLRVRLHGYIVGATENAGLFIGDRRLPDLSLNWVNVFPFKPGCCSFVYGEKREIPEDVRANLTTETGESALTLHFPFTNEILTLFFTI